MQMKKLAPLIDKNPVCSNLFNKKGGVSNDRRNSQNNKRHPSHFRTPNINFVFIIVGSALGYLIHSPPCFYYTLYLKIFQAHDYNFTSCTAFAVTGRVNPKVEPTPTVEVTKTFPPWCFSIVVLTSCKPKPVPLIVWVAFSTR